MVLGSKFVLAMIRAVKKAYNVKYNADSRSIKSLSEKEEKQRVVGLTLLIVILIVMVNER